MVTDQFGFRYPHPHLMMDVGKLGLGRVNGGRGECGLGSLLTFFFSFINLSISIKYHTYVRLLFIIC